MINATDTNNYAPIIEPQSAPPGVGFEMTNKSSTGATADPFSGAFPQPVPTGNPLQNLFDMFNQLLNWLKSMGAQPPTSTPPAIPNPTIEPSPPGAPAPVDNSTTPPPGNPNPIQPKPPGTGFDPDAPTTMPTPDAPGKTENKKQKTEPKKLEIGKKVSRTDGFLWKPESEKNGKLVILLPEHLTGRVKRVSVLSPDGTKVLDRGESSGVANGNREHFRFDKPGDKFPDGAIVVITLEDGRKFHMVMKETSKRFEG